ncbi:MAG: NlpC/P60 family protein [Thiohalocapsa sp.]
MPQTPPGNDPPLDPRLHAYSPDLADARLRGRVAASRFVAGRPARVVAGRVPVRRRPQPRASAAETETFYHYGEPLLVFEEADGQAWCQSLEDGYVGYVAAHDIALGEPPPPTHVVATLGSYLYPAPDLRWSPSDFLPRHSRLVVVEPRQGLTTRGTDYARLDTGGFLPSACLATAPPRSSSLSEAAALYLGAPYLWGGRSFLGIDCSGLVQSAFRDLGIVVPRDTDLQREAIGEPVEATGVAALRPDDLLYVPGHVLIHAGDGLVIHADGASMTVRRDHLDDLVRAGRIAWDNIVVRRHHP